MLTTKEIKGKIIKENKNVNPLTIDVFESFDKDGGSRGVFALIYNCQVKNTSAITEADKKKLIQLTTGSPNDALNIFLEYYRNKPKMIEMVTDYALKKESLQLPIKEIFEYFESVKEPEQERVEEDGILKPHGSIGGYKVNVNNGTLDGNAIFNSQITVEKIGSKKKEITRCFVENIETQEDARGKGLCREMVTKMLPALCTNDNIPAIVLQASAFDTNSAVKGGQEKLEKFYADSGFTRVTADEDDIYTKFDDFDEGMPVFVKEVIQENALTNDWMF